MKKKLGLFKPEIVKQQPKSNFFKPVLKAQKSVLQSTEQKDAVESVAKKAECKFEVKSGDVDENIGLSRYETIEDEQKYQQSSKK